MRWLVALAVCGCAGSGGADVASAAMALTGPNDVASVEVLVLDGPEATCAHALTGVTPLDDSAWQVVAHALFTVDGTAKHLRIPAGRALVFYAEAYRADRSRLGRGCVVQSLAAGASSSVMITIASGD